MKLLSGKNALVFGVANDHSIAWGIAKALHAHGAQVALSYAAPQLERRVRPLAESIQAPLVEKCDLAHDEEIEALFAKVADQLQRVDILIHAVAFAQREDLTGRYLDTQREGFRLALDISVYTFTALARACEGLMPPGGSMLTMTYYGGQKAVPHYNVMGVAKAALEASVRYLAVDLGPQGIRVNAISAGPVRTLAAAGIPGFRRMHRAFQSIAPLRQGITIDDVGQTAAWLCSPMAAKITGEVIFVDSGYHVLGLTAPQDGA